MLAFFYLMGAGFSSFFLVLVVINSVNPSDSFLDNFVITCKFFFLHIVRYRAPLRFLFLCSRLLYCDRYRRLGMDWLYFFLGISAGVALKLILYSDDVSRGKLLLAVLFSVLILGILFLLEQKNCSEIPAKKNNSESSCWFQLEQKKLSGQFFVFRICSVGNQSQIAM